MAGKRNNKHSVEKTETVAKKAAITKAAHDITPAPGRLEGQSIEEWRKHAAHRGNVIHSSGGESWFEAKPPAGE